MWVQWVKKSSSTRVHTRSPSLSDHHMTSPFHRHSPSLLPSSLSSPSPLSPRTPIHKHSMSFKDIESLVLNKEPFSPTTRSGPKPSPSPTHLSLKNIHTLFDNENENESKKQQPSIFHRVRAWAHRQAHPSLNPPPNSNNKVVVYYTSLRVVRRTFEDCKIVLSILRGYRVRIDERDLSMDNAYVEELVKVIGGKKEREKVVKMIPIIFVNGKCIGGVDDIKRLHESGELKIVLRDVPVEKVTRNGIYNDGRCTVCGGCRFVVCEYCDGSHKVFVDGAFVSCHVCNSNGLVKCPCC